MFHPILIESIFQPTLRFAQCHHVYHDTQSAYIERNEKGYLLKIRRSELVGRRLEEIHLTVEDDVITLEIPALELKVPETLTPIFEELPTEAHIERYRLPRGIDLNTIEAELIDDELFIKLPRKAVYRQSVEIKGV